MRSARQARPLCKPDRSDCFSRGQNSIEEQLEEYIVENLEFCLTGFVPLIGQGFDVKISEEIEPEVTITKDDVRVYLFKGLLKGFPTQSFSIL